MSENKPRTGDVTCYEQKLSRMRTWGRLCGRIAFLKKRTQRKTKKVVFQKTLNNQGSTDLESLGVSAQVSGPLEG